MELSTRYSGEENVIKDILAFNILVNKTVRLHTFFTKSGLEYILKKLSENENLYSFVFDLTEVFRVNISYFNNSHVEDEIINIIASTSTLMVPDEDKQDCLLPNHILGSMVEEQDIKRILKANKWLLVIVLMRFTNLSYIN